jgi:hypothetical protein
MTITLSNPAQLNAVLAALNPDADGMPAVARPNRPAELVKAEPKEETAKAEVKAAEEPAALTYEFIAKVVKELAPKNRDALVEILAKHGGTKLGEIEKAKWPALLADLHKALA